MNIHLNNSKESTYLNVIHSSEINEVSLNGGGYLVNYISNLLEDKYTKQSHLVIDYTPLSIIESILTIQDLDTDEVFIKTINFGNIYSTLKFTYNNGILFI